MDNDETPTFGGALATTQSGLELSFEQPGTTGEQVLSHETASGVGNLSLYVVSRTYPNAAVSCDYVDDVFATLGQTTVDGVIASCTLTAAADESHELC